MNLRTRVPDQPIAHGREGYPLICIPRDGGWNRRLARIHPDARLRQRAVLAAALAKI